MVHTYKAILVHIMSYVSGYEYNKDYELSQEELGALKPMNVKIYRFMKAYGTAEPNRDDHPLFARSSNVCKVKHTHILEEGNILLHAE
jgi:hypothetical protein